MLQMMKKPAKATLPPSVVLNGRGSRIMTLPPRPTKAKGRPRTERLAIDKSWFQETIKRMGKTQHQLAVHILKSDEELSRSLSGGRRFTIDEVHRMADFFGVPLDEIFVRLGMPTPGVAVPIAGRILGSGEVSPIHPDLGKPARVPHLQPGAEAYVAETGGGLLDAYDGATFVCTKAGPVAPEAVGRLCRLDVEGGTVPVMAYLLKGQNRGLFDYMPFGGKDRKANQRVLRAAVVLAIFFPDA